MPLSASAGRARVRDRLFGVMRFVALSAVTALFLPTGDPKADPVTKPTTGPTTAPAALAAGPNGIPGEVVAALRSLKSTKADDRAAAYATLTDKGDARILPALTGFFRGELHLRDADGKASKTGERLAIYGPSYDKPGGGKSFPVLDALTGQPFPGPDGQPIVVSGRFPDLSSAFTKPLNAIQQKPVLELRAFLSLLHPDPEVRLASIRDAGERAARVFPDPDEEAQIRADMKRYADLIKQQGAFAAEVVPPEANAALLAAIEPALAEKPAGMFVPAPGKDAIGKVVSALGPVVQAAKEAKTSAPNKAAGKPAEVKVWPDAPERPSDPRVAALAVLAEKLPKYKDTIEALEKNLEELPRTAAALDKQLKADPAGPFAKDYREAIAQMDAALGDDKARAAAIPQLGEFGTGRCANMLRKLKATAERTGDAALAAAVAPALAKAEGYQLKVRLVQYTFAGLSTGSIYVLLALGLAVIFGLMGVINMAHGEFMMVGAFTTLVVATYFKEKFPGSYDYFPVVAVPAAFLVAGLVGLVAEVLVIRHLYGRTTETLLATIGVGFVLTQSARWYFGSNVSYAAPRWMQGSMEVMPDLLLNRARLWTIVYCVLCIATVYLIVNKTKLGLLLRATTQNRKMAAALGVPTRRVDAMTFAFGAGLAGTAGVVVPMIDKINPEMGQDYVVMSFMVVVVGGVGKLAGAIIAGLGLGLTGNYLEPALSSIQMFARTSSVLSKVVVLALIVAFLQKRPSGLFPPKGRTADA
ncbi:MAG TPA: urea ABC transporter permease subunit UrtB [Humisphaera sp.]